MAAPVVTVTDCTCILQAVNTPAYPVEFHVGAYESPYNYCALCFARCVAGDPPPWQYYCEVFTLGVCRLSAGWLNFYDAGPYTFRITLAANGNNLDWILRAGPTNLWSGSSPADGTTWDNVSIFGVDSFWDNENLVLDTLITANGDSYHYPWNSDTEIDDWTVIYGAPYTAGGSLRAPLRVAWKIQKSSWQSGGYPPPLPMVGKTGGPVYPAYYLDGNHLHRFSWQKEAGTDYQYFDHHLTDDDGPSWHQMNSIDFDDGDLASASTKPCWVWDPDNGWWFETTPGALLGKGYGVRHVPRVDGSL